MSNTGYWEVKIDDGAFRYSFDYTVTNTSNTQTKMDVTAVRVTRIGLNDNYVTSVYVYFDGLYCTVNVNKTGVYSLTGLSKTYTRGHSATNKSASFSVRGVSSGKYYTYGDWSMTIPARPSYSVTYSANGGSGTTSDQVKWHDEALTLRANNFTKTNAVFNKWNTAAGGTGASYAAGDSYTANANLALYAQWLGPYTVSYNANGGSGSITPQTKVHNKALTLASSGFTRSGFGFKRWNTNTSDTGTAYNAGGTYTANASATLYAIWNHTVTYHANSGMNAPAAQTAIATQQITLTTAKPTRAGYEFVNWNTASGGGGTSYIPGGSYPANQPNVTLYAQWKPLVSATVLDTRVIRTATDQSTVEDDEGTYAYVEVKAKASGPAAATMRFSLTSADSSVQVVLGTSSATKTAGDDKTVTFTARVKRGEQGLDLDSQYDLTATVTVSNTSAEQTAITLTRKLTVAAAFFTMDVLAGGHGVSFGGPAKSEGFFVHMRSFFQNLVRIVKPTSSPPTHAIEVSDGTSDTFTVDWDGATTAHNGFLARSDNLTSNVTPSSTAGGYGVQMYDSAGTFIGATRPHFQSDGNQGVQLYVQRVVGGTTKWNILRLGIDSAGNPTVNLTVADQAAWLAALAVNAWTSVGVASFITFNTGWASNSTTVEYNAALGIMRVYMNLKATAAQSAGNKTIGTVAAAYRPKRVSVSLPSLVSAHEAGYIDANGSFKFNLSSALAINATSVYFLGEYHIG